MREIKFRAWAIGGDLETGEGVKSGNGIMDYNPLTSWEEHINDVLKSDGSVIFMQFTGLHDKNGKEIYEGDIVEIQCLGYKDKFKTKAVVEWNEKNAGFDMRIIGIPIKPLDEHKSNKILGNIYENGDLLNETNLPRVSK